MFSFCLFYLFFLSEHRYPSPLVLDVFLEHKGVPHRSLLGPCLLVKK